MTPPPEKISDTIPGRRIALGEFDGEQIEPRLLVRLIETAALAAEHALEAQRGAAAPVFRGMLGIDHRHPVETVERHDEAMFARQPKHVADPHQRVLHMGRDHLDVVAVERDELEFFGADAHAGSLPCFGVPVIGS